MRRSAVALTSFAFTRPLNCSFRTVFGITSMDASASGEAVAGWTPSSWKSFPIKQQPTYADPTAVEKALAKVRSLPPLIHPKEVKALKSSLVEAGRGHAFLLQGGDCAERFLDCSMEPIESKFKILLQMSLIIISKARVPVVRLARTAGQFAKPRTSPTEIVNGKEVCSFKGDNINGFAPEEREPDPNRLVQAYFHSAATLNYLRAMISGGVASLSHARGWNLKHVQNEGVRKEYEVEIEKILDNISFLHTIHADEISTLKTVDLFTSHEGLLLNYEEALTYQVHDKFYNLGAHFLWIGDRTRQIDGAHVEYFRGVANPIGVKVGPTTSEEDLEALIRKLNPKNEEGRLALITRYGCGKVSDLLPKHIAVVRKVGVSVVWICDPCHGNTETTANGVKTRHYEKMVSELLQTFDIHRKEGSILGGAHLELTGEDVTECIGGSPNLNAESLSQAYETFCDPRLNYTQSLDVAFTIARKLKELRTPAQERVKK